MTERQPSDFRFVIRQTHASPAADGTSPTVVDTIGDRVVATFDANERAVAVSEALEAAHDVGVTLRLALGQATDPAPLAEVGDVLREAAAGVLLMHARTERQQGVVSAGTYAARVAEADTLRAQLAAEKARADDLSRMVAAMVEASREVGSEWFYGMDDVTAERGRWVPIDHYRSVYAERDAAIARAEKAEAEAALWIDRYDDLDQRWEVMRKRARDAERSRDAAIARAEKAEAAADEAENDLGVIVEAIRTHFPNYVSVTDGDEFSPVETLEEVAREFKMLGKRLADVEADRRVVSAATYAQRAAERDEAYADRDEWKARAEKAEALIALYEQNTIPARDAAERSRDELGIQLAAQSERLRLAMAVVDAARETTVTRAGEMLPALNRIYRALAALDAVPGDALASALGLPPPPVRPTPALGVALRTYEAEHDIGPALDRAHEASGVVADGVKWGNRIRVVNREEYDTLIRQRADDIAALNEVQAMHAQAVAERDAAVARNIILWQQKEEEAEAARIDRVPVADFYHRVREVLEAAGVGEDVIDKVREIPGWDGTEGGYSPGLETTTFVYRDSLNKALAERDEAQRQVEALRACIEDYKADHRAVVEGKCAGDERHCSCVPHLRRGLADAQRQVEAMRERADELANLLKMHHVGHGAFGRSGCGVCRPIDAALDDLRALAVPSTKGGG